MATPNPGNMRRPKPGNTPIAKPTPPAARPAPAAPRPARDPSAAGLPDVFINPYTFVPLPEQVERGAPAGHAKAAPGNLSGSLTVTFTAKSRVLTRGGPNGGPPISGGVPIIPGSSLHGALRSMHETLCGGCLRVFDRDFVPVYRDAVTAKVMVGWELAVVGSIDREGRPLTLSRCNKTALGKHSLLQGLGARSGMRLSITGAKTDAKKQRGKMTVWSEATIRPDAAGPWVLLLSDGSARQVQDVGSGTTRRKETRYYAVFGEVDGGSEVLGPDDDVWTLFQTRANGARDVDEALQGFTGTRASKLQQLRDKELAQPSPVYEAASFTDHRGVDVRVGERIATRPWLRVGQPLWVRVANGRVTDLKVSMVWRHLGTGKAGQRVPPSLLACEQWDRLCPSCQIFGSADTTGRADDEAATQQAYRGHVRVGDLVPDGVLPSDLESLQLAPLSAPRPGSGQFYLENGHRKLPTGEEPALREWGAAPDRGDKPRHIRGRKRYWATSDPRKRSHPRWKKREGQSDQFPSLGLAFPQGTVFTGTITFDNLTAAQVGSLIASLDPRTVLGDQDGVDAAALVFTIGGGRPFGFGACQVDVDIDWIDTAGSRWGQATATTPKVPELVAAFLGQPGLPQQTWPQLAAACQFNRVDPDLVWYPPGAGWSDVGQDEFDEGFTFWQQSEGKAYTDELRPLTALPDPAKPAAQQQLKIARGEGKR